MSYNPASPKALESPVDFSDLDRWLTAEISVLPPEERDVLNVVSRNLTYFARWPQEPHVFIEGVTRPSNRAYHTYDSATKLRFKARTNVQLDTRPNGPAIAAFIFAGGERPQRTSSTNAWSIHHIYNGKFPYVGRHTTLHAIKDGSHFSNSAGLVAVHPILDIQRWHGDCEQKHSSGSHTTLTMSLRRWSSERALWPRPEPARPRAVAMGRVRYAADPLRDALRLPTRSYFASRRMTSSRS